MPAGRPPKILDESRIRELAATGRTKTEIAALLGVHVNTLCGNYSEAIEQGRQLMRGSLRSKQYEVAMDGNSTMLIWLGKQELEQRDKVEHASDSEKPFTVVMKIVGQPNGK